MDKYKKIIIIIVSVILGIILLWAILSSLIIGAGMKVYDSAMPEITEGGLLMSE